MATTGGKPIRRLTQASARAAPAAYSTPEQRAARGRACRSATPRSAHAAWDPAADRSDPVALLEDQAADREPELVPIRYGRMAASPFAFFRGAAAVMAADLATTPVTGLRVQACGDAHLSNFGQFATPERNLIFDINDFDETLPGPWEWDVKRLCASLAVATRDNGHTDEEAEAVATECVRAYRVRLREYSKMSPLEV